MAKSNVQRKLTAVFVTDVVGYSRLMGEDPYATVATLAEYRDVFSSLIQFQRGRVVNAPGGSIPGVGLNGNSLNWSFSDDKAEGTRPVAGSPGAPWAMGAYEP